MAPARPEEDASDDVARRGRLRPEPDGRDPGTADRALLTAALRPVEALATAMAALSTDLAIVAANGSFRRLLGLEPDGALPALPRLAMGPEGRAAIERLRFAEPGTGVDVTLLRQGRMPAFVRLSLAPQRREDGTVAGYLVAAEDRSGERSAEAERDQLARRLDQTRRDLWHGRPRAGARDEDVRTALGGVADGVVTVDRDWRVTHFNAVAAAACGLDDESIGRSLFALRPEWEVSAGDALRAAAERGLPAHVEIRSPSTGAVTALAVYPQAEGCVLLLLDLARSQQRDERLRLLEAAVENCSDIVLITEAAPLDEPGPRIVFVNKAFTELTGYGREEVMGRSPRLLQGPETDRGTLRAIREGLRAQMPVRAEVVNYTRTGEAYWLELAICPIRDGTGTVTHHVSVQRNITERKETQSLLVWQAAMLDRAQDAITVRDLDDTILFWNRRAEAIYGWSRAEALGRKARDVLGVEGDVLALAAAETVRRGSWGGRLRARRKDGATLTMDGHWSYVPATAERRAIILTIDTDITEQVLLEEKMAQRARLESIGKLTGGIAHDFNNLLTIILGSTELMEAKAMGQPQLLDLARMSRSAAQRGSEMVQRLLAFARRQPLSPQPTDVNRMLAEMRGVLTRLLPESIAVRHVLAPDLWPAQVDPGQLESVVLNLALNARDAMLPAGGALTVLTDTVTATGEDPDLPPGDYVRVTVRDTGCGIAPDTLPRVFEPFYTTKPFGEGSGMGLAMAYGFAKQSRGHIALESTMGEGTTVRLYLPRAAEATDELQSTARPEGEAVAGGDERILLVEDEEAVREQTARLLGVLGYRVLEARSGPEALALVERGAEFDLLLTDVVMPGGMDGRQLATRVQALRPGLPVMLMSGYSEDLASPESPGLKESVFLQKPFRLAQLAARTRTALGGAARR